ncbi:Gustatory receptor 107b, partial [Halyomorpha halys]
MAETNNDVMCDIERAIYDLWSVPRFMGTYPFNRNYEFDPYRLIFLFFNFTAYVYISSPGFQSGLSFITSVIFLFILFMLISPPIIHLIWLYLKVSHLKEFHSEISQVGKYFRSVGVKWDFSYYWIYKYSSLILILQLFIISSFLAPTLTSSYFINLSWLYVSVYSLYDQIFGLFELTSYSFSRLKHITNDKKLLKSREIMVSLCKVIEELFSAQILYIIAMSFSIGLSVMFQILSKRKNKNWIAIWSALILTIYPIIRMITSVRSIVMQVKKIDKHLYKRLMANPYD